MLVKTEDLTGAALDWAMATVEGEDVLVHGVGQYRYDKRGGIHCCKYGCTFGPRSPSHDVSEYSPSTDWSQGGPLIAKYRVGIYCDYTPAETITANVTGSGAVATGDTFLVAACRAIVAAKLGDFVEIPDELMQR